MVASVFIRIMLLCNPAATGISPSASPTGVDDASKRTLLAHALGSATGSLAWCNPFEREAYAVHITLSHNTCRIKFYPISRIGYIKVDLEKSDAAGVWKVRRITADPPLKSSSTESLSATRSLSTLSFNFNDEPWIVSKDIRISSNADADNTFLFRISSAPHFEWNAIYYKVSSSGRLLEKYRGY